MDHDSTLRRFLAAPVADAHGKRGNAIGRRQADKEVRWVLSVLDDRQVELRERVDKLTAQLDRHATWLKVLLVVLLGADATKLLLP